MLEAGEEKCYTFRKKGVDSMLGNTEYVYAVYQKKSFSKAAESLHVSQPALSTAIRKIEAELGQLLFDRSSTPIELTEAGRCYIDAAERIRDIEGELYRQLEAIARSRRTRIRLGSSSFFCTYVLPPLCERFRAANPEAEISLTEVNSGEIEWLFREDKLDLCLTVDSLKSELASCVWRQEEIILAVPAELPLSDDLRARALSFSEVLYGGENCPSVNLASFSGLPFLFLKEGNDLGRRAAEMCRHAGFEPRVVMYLDQLLTSYYVACSGKGAAFIRPDLLRYEGPTDKLLYFRPDDSLVARDIRIYYRRDALSPAAERFLRFLQS